MRRASSTRLLALAFTAVAIGTLVGMIGIFAWQVIPVLQHEGLSYFTGTQWFYRASRFGALPMIYGTAAVSLIALLVALPLGLGAAICSAEYLPRRLRLAAKVLIELLAGVPSVVYGLLGILFLRQWVYDGFARFDPLSGDSLLTAGLLLAVMVLPTVMTLSDDALRGVSSRQRLAARGLGLTRAEVILTISLPQAAPGIFSAALLGLGRALGETIAVFLVIGRQDNNLPASVLTLRPLLEAGQTLTSKLGGSETDIAYGNPLHWAAMLGLGLILLLLVALITFAGGALKLRSSSHA